jgi:hypothetical protein
LDTTDPVAVSKIAQKLDWEKTVFFVSSKSGTTLETVSLFYYFYNLALEKIGNGVRRNFIIITDPGSSLEELAYRLSLKYVFKTNPAIGGRFSALSFPGIVPAAILGLDVKSLLKNAQTVAKNEKACFINNIPTSNGTVLGASLGTLAQMGRDKLTFISPPLWRPFGVWLEQLIAESTGKECKGILPVCEKQINEPAVYNNDRFFVIFHTGKTIKSPEISELIKAGHPVITVRVDDKFQLGGQIFLWELATAVAGHVLGINPFDQPNVEASKILTRRMIDMYRNNKELPLEKAFLKTEECDVYGYAAAETPSGALKNFLAGAKEGDYVCLQVYLGPTSEVDEVLDYLRTTISKKYRKAVTICYGPRYLHSTGQLHKGDGGKGLFIQFTDDIQQDIEIPDKPGISGSTFTFGVYKSAQAIGDMQALIKLGRRSIRFLLKKDPAITIRSMADFI